MSAPFGIKMHSPVNNYDETSSLNGGLLAITPPKPQPAFAEYIVQGSGNHGIVWVKAISPAFENDAYGTNVQAALQRVSKQLSNKYGMPEKVDFLGHEALFAEPNDWVMSLLQQERHAFHVWKKAEGANLPDDLETVFLGYLPLSTGDCSFVLEYASPHQAAADDEQDEQLSDLL